MDHGACLQLVDLHIGSHRERSILRSLTRRRQRLLQFVLMSIAAGNSPGAVEYAKLRKTSYSKQGVPASLVKGQGSRQIPVVTS